MSWKMTPASIHTRGLTQQMFSKGLSSLILPQPSVCHPSPFHKLFHGTELACKPRNLPQQNNLHTLPSLFKSSSFTDKGSEKSKSNISTWRFYFVSKPSSLDTQGYVKYQGWLSQALGRRMLAQPHSYCVSEAA